MPLIDEGVNTLRARRAKQLRTVGRFKVFHDFQLTDKQPESGLGFVHRPLPDGLKEYKMVHYDHGNGVVAADVDADGHYDLYFVNQLGNKELWKNLGGGRFKDVTAEAGVGLSDDALGGAEGRAEEEQVDVAGRTFQCSGTSPGHVGTLRADVVPGGPPDVGDRGSDGSRRHGQMGRAICPLTGAPAACSGHPVRPGRGLGVFNALLKGFSSR